MAMEVACYLIEYFRQVGQPDEITSLRLYDDINPIKSLHVAGHDVAVCNHMQELEPDAYEFIVGVGNPKVKKILVEKALQHGFEPAKTFVHWQATCCDSDLGRGGVIAPGARLTAGIKIGDYVILNSNVTVGHGTVIGDFTSANPGAHISGDVTIGSDVIIGVGAVVLEKITIANDVIIGAQAMVCKDIMEPHGVHIGVPSRPMRRSA